MYIGGLLLTLDMLAVGPIANPGLIWLMRGVHPSYLDLGCNKREATNTGLGRTAVSVLLHGTSAP